MATFRYQSLSAGGAGTIDAPDRASAVRELLRRGVTPTSMDPVADTRPGDAARAAGESAFLSRPVMSRAEMASFVRELATAVQAGLPLVQGLRTIATQLRVPRQRVMLDTIIDQVEHGKSLGDAAEAWGKPFTDLTINLIRSGEVSGRLPEVLAQAADLLDRDVKMRRTLLAATLYPIILMVLISGAIVVIVTVIVPRVLKSIEGVSKTLPLPTRIVQGFADFLGSWGWLVALLAVGGVLIVRRILARPGPRLWLDTQLLRVPVLGRLLRDVAVARFTRTLGTLTAAGIPVLAALKVTRGTLGNKAMERVIDDVCEQIAGGKTIAEPMQRSGHFPPMLVQIVNMGERSGRLDQMLSQAAGAFEERTETSLKLFTTALPPLLVAMMAGVVGFIVLAILLPLLEMQDAVGRM
jgi:general secretion pathway protein F